MIDVVELTRDLVRIPSVNPMGSAADADTLYEHRVTAYLDDLFSKRGWPTYRQLVEKVSSKVRRENFLTVLEGNPVAPTLMLEVHQDTVPVTGMTIEPFSGDLSDNRIYGRGACDVKGGMACLIATLVELAELPKSSRPNLILACTINEENGFSGAYRLKELWESGECLFLPKAPDAIIVTEPTELQVVVAHKGVVRWKIRTLGKACHSSDPNQGENAIYAMAPVITRLEAYAKQIVGNLCSHPLVGNSTLSVGTIAGGISVNSVPDVCEIHIDRRLCPGESPSAAREHVMSFLNDALPTFKMEATEPDIVSPGLDGAIDSRLAKQLIAAAQAKDIDCSAIGVLYGTDAAVLSSESVPTVVFGPGSIDQAHTAEEWIDIDQLRKAIEVLTQFAMSFN